MPRQPAAVPGNPAGGLGGNVGARLRAVQVIVFGHKKTASDGSSLAVFVTAFG